MSRDFKTGDLVLCKVGSYEPWPSVVFPQKLLAPDIYSKRKQGKIVVRFFQDQTYSWSLSKKLIPLNKSIIKKYLNSHNNSGGNKSDLYEAYKEALNYTNLHTYLFNLNENSVEFEIVKQFLQKTGVDEIVGGEDPYLGKPIYSSIGIGSISTTTTTDSPSSKRKKTVKNSEDSMTNDMSRINKHTIKQDTATNNNSAFDELGDEKIVKKLKLNNGIVSDSDSDLSLNKSSSVQQMGTKAPSSSSTSSSSSSSSSSASSISDKRENISKKKIILHYERRLETCLLFRRKIQITLIQRDVPPSQDQLNTIDEYFKTILEQSKKDSILKSKKGIEEDFKIFFDLDSLRTSKLPKLLKTIINNKNLLKYHNICKKILLEWQDYVLILKNEKNGKNNNNGKKSIVIPETSSVIENKDIKIE